MNRIASPAQALREIGGGFGDIGLLAPLAVALITLNHLNATVVVAGAGLFYLVTAAIYRLPVPVQPLKAVSSLAIALRVGMSGIAAAGLEIGAAFVLLSVTGLATILQRVFVRPIVRGIQLSIGLLLAKAAIDLMLANSALHFGSGPFARAGVAASILIGLVTFAALVIIERRRVPAGPLILLAAGLTLGIVFGNGFPQLAFGPQPMMLRFPTPHDFAYAFIALTLPQVGLSIGNSLMATSSAALAYFGDAGRRVTPARLALTMGVANLVVSPLGGMPMCHGAGGMTAHYRTGARTGLGIAVYGGLLVALGLLFGQSVAALVGILPLAVLGGFLLYVGIQHAALIADMESGSEFLVAGSVAAVAVPTSNITVGVLLGLGMYWLMRLVRERAGD